MEQSARIPSAVLTTESSRSLVDFSRPVLIYVAVFVVYFAAGRIGLAVPFTSGNVSPVWPSAGVAVAMLLVFGNRVWPAVLAAAFAINFFTGIPFTASAGIGIGNALGPLVGASLFRRSHLNPKLTRLRDVLGLLFYSVLIGTALTATIGVTTLSLAGVHAWTGMSIAWLIWWLGDAMGVLLVAPLLLTLPQLLHTPARSRVFEFVLLALLSGIASIVLLDNRIGFRLVEDVLAFAVFPFILWGAIRLQVTGSAVAACVIACIAVFETALGFGPFVRHGSPLHNAAVLQAFIAVLSLSGLILAVVICEKQETQEELHLQTQRLVDTVSNRLQLAQQAADIGAWEWNLRTGAISWSEELELMHGFAAGSFDGKYETWAASVHPDDREWVQREVLTAVKENRNYDVEYRSVRPDGSSYWTAARGRVLPDESGEPERLVGICMNIDQRKLAEQALRNSEKLAATGRLAATMAHEINNPLEAVTNLLYLARNANGTPTEVRDYLTVAEEELERVGHIAKRTLAFYRDPASPVVMDLPHAIDEVLGIFQRKLEAKQVRVVKRYAEEVSIVCNSGEIRQVLSNIILNAIDAVPERGTLHVRVARVRSPGDSTVSGIRISVADNGAGISSQDRTRIFEPFFTTKKDVGTGLGLWISHSIVLKHGGSIRVKSSTAKGTSGTVLSIFLPHRTNTSVAASG